MLNYHKSGETSSGKTAGERPASWIKPTPEQRDEIRRRWAHLRGGACTLPAPSTIPPDENIPDEMKEVKRWIVWRDEAGRKIPYMATSGGKASSTDISTWCDYNTAVQALKHGRYSGLGFVLGDGFAGIDLDDCLTETGAFAWGGDIVDALKSYKETSPSGTGVKIFIRATKPPGAGCKKTGLGPDGIGQLEIFDSGRYFTVTGQILDNTSPKITDCQVQLDSLCSIHWPPEIVRPRSLPLVCPRRPGDNVKRFHAYLKKMPPAVSGQGGHDQTFTAAMEGFRFGLTESELAVALAEYNNRCDPPWSESELAHKIKSARARIGSEFGCRLSEERPGRSKNAIPISNGTTGDRPASGYASFPLMLLPAPIDDYINQGAAALGCDPAYIAVPLLAAAGSAIGNTRIIQLKKGWREPPVIWAAVVGESGTVKSPALELALRPMWRRQSAALKRYGTALAQYRTQMTSWKAEKKSDRGPEPEPPAPCEHVVCVDITIEALADRLAARGSTIVAPDELAGWFNSFNQYKKSGADVSHWLSLFGARALKVDRKTGDRTTIYIPCAAVAVTGTIQPKTLSSVLTPDFFSNGLTARMLLARPNTTPKRWSEVEIDDTADKRVMDLFDRLFALKSCDGVNGDSEPVTVDLLPDAKEQWISFVNDHGTLMDGMTGNERAAYSKLEGYAARFALIFHCIRQASGEKQNDYVDLDDIDKAIQLVRWFGNETLRVYAELFDGEIEPQNDLVDLMRCSDGIITERDLMRGPRKYRSPGAAAAALQDLVNKKLAEFFYPHPKTTGGQPVKTFRLIGLAAGDGDSGNTSKTAIVSPEKGNP